MEDEVLEEVMKACTWKEKVILKVFRGTFDKVYHVTRIKIVNQFLKQ